MNDRLNINFCRCCLLDFIGNNDNPPLNMQNETFAYGNQKISFVDGYFDVNNSSIEDFPSVPVSEVQICSFCVVQLESAYVFKKLCQEANTILHRKYSRFEDATNEIKCELMENEDEAEMSSGSAKMSTIQNETCVAEDTSDQEMKIEKFEDIVFPTVNSKPRRASLRKKQIVKKSTKPYNEPNKLTNDGAGTSTSSTENSNKESEATSDQEPEIELFEETDFSTVKSVSLRKKKVVAKSNEPINEKNKLLLTNYKFQKPSKAALKKKHIEIVNLGRRYACKLCTKTYSTNKALTSHNRVKHLKQLYPCHLCEKKFACGSSCHRHIKINHLNQYYTCKICDIQYNSVISLWSHSFQHRGFMPFKCTECNYKSAWRKDFQKHLAKHHGIKYNHKIHGYKKETFTEVLSFVR